MDIVIHTDSTATYRNPRAIARLLNANGYKTRTVVVIDRETGLTSICNWDDAGAR